MGLILHLAANAATRPSRILKEAASALRSGHATEVRVLARAAEGHADAEALAPGVRVERIALRTAGLPRRGPFQVLKLFEWQRAVLSRGRQLSPILVQAHGLATLAAALRIGRAVGCPVVYDAHELETEQGQPRWRVPFDRFEERRLIHKPQAMLCVSDSIADWYVEAYGIARPIVVRNVPDLRLQAVDAGRGMLRAKFAVPDDALVFIYQGALSPGRRIEQLLRVFARPDMKAHLVLMGYGELEAVIRDASVRSANIHFQPAVAPTEVLKMTAGADVGICGGENVCLSYYFSLPNKLFEYLAAGLPILAPRWPEMTRVIDEHGCGWVVGESDDDWFAAVSALSTAEIDTVRARSQEAARAYSWEREERALLDVYDRLLLARKRP